MTEFQKALSNIPAICNVADKTTFTYDYTGAIASPSDYIWGIDCRSNEKKQYPGYFSQFKRTIKNSNPTSEQYLNSNYVTIWTLYPARNTTFIHLNH